MQQNTMMDGNRYLFGSCSNFTQMPISGRLRMTSMRLPIHMLAISPQNSSGCLAMMFGPG